MSGSFDPSGRHSTPSSTSYIAWNDSFNFDLTEAGGRWRLLPGRAQRTLDGFFRDGTNCGTSAGTEGKRILLSASFNSLGITSYAAGIHL